MVAAVRSRRAQRSMSGDLALRSCSRTHPGTFPNRASNICWSKAIWPSVRPSARPFSALGVIYRCQGQSGADAVLGGSGRGRYASSPILLCSRDAVRIILFSSRSPPLPSTANARSAGLSRAHPRASTDRMSSNSYVTVVPPTHRVSSPIPCRKREIILPPVRHGREMYPPPPFRPAPLRLRPPIHDARLPPSGRAFRKWTRPSLARRRTP